MSGAAAVDSAYVLIDGPWQHRFVPAHGARFHVAELGEGPMVVLLHGFPQFWWCWRHQLVALAEAGYRAVAMDLRGYGGSDKPPRGYDTLTLAADVAAVVRSLGEPGAVMVGHGWGGWLAWSMPSLQTRVTRAVASLSMPHPLRMRASMRNRLQRRASGYIASFQIPFLGERQLGGGDSDAVGRLLRAWSGPGWPSEEELERYTLAMRVPFVAHSALEYYRWAFRSIPRRDGRRFTDRVSDPIDVPVLQLHGAEDGCVLPASARGSERYVEAPYRFELLPGAGHFLPEEAPDRVNSLLLDWLARLEA